MTLLAAPSRLASFLAYALSGATTLLWVGCAIPSGPLVVASAISDAATPLHRESLKLVPALLLLAEPRDSRAAVWIGLLALSLVSGLLVALFWRDSPAIAGLPWATWLTWLLAGVVPFFLIVFGWVIRRPEA